MKVKVTTNDESEESEVDEEVIIDVLLTKQLLVIRGSYY